MEYEADRIFEISLAKFDRSKTSRKQSSTSSKLHRNLLVTSVLKAITTDSSSGNESLMDYRESKIIDMDLDEANYDMVNQERCQPIKANRTCTGSKAQNGYEWRPRVCGGECSCDIGSEHSSAAKACQLSGIHKELSTVDVMLDCSSPDSDKETCENIQSVLPEQEIRKNLTTKRPRDSSSDMNPMPRPNKIFKAYDSCNHIKTNDAHNMSTLENLFRDGFNELVEQNNMDRPNSSIHSFMTFPLVTVMAC